MSDLNVKEIADKANFIASGYAFTTKDNGFVSVLNLEHPECAIVLNRDGEIIETNMDQIEQQIVLEIFNRNLEFLEDK